MSLTKFHPTGRHVPQDAGLQMSAYLRNRDLVSHISADSSVTGLESSQILQTADGQVVMNHSHCFVTEFL
jgi:hypothetical protein